MSERFNVKDAAVLSGAIGAVTDRLGIATAATNHNTRHLLATATMATTMHRLTGGRFSLGLGRGFDFLFDVINLPRITNAQIEDAVGIYRRLWHGEVVMGHDGPAGTYSVLHQDARFAEDIPVILCALAERTLERAGTYVDGVVLHTYFTDETLARSVAAVRRGAERAGRDPESVRVWSVLGTVGDHLPHELRLKKTVGRLGTYLQGYGDLLVGVNRWDPEVLARFRADDVVASIPGAIDAIGTTEQLEHIATLFPDEWTAAAAVGSPGTCAAACARPVHRGRRQRDPARGHAGRARAGGRGLPLGPTRRARRAPRQPRLDDRARLLTYGPRRCGRRPCGAGRRASSPAWARGARPSCVVSMVTPPIVASVSTNVASRPTSPPR